MLEDIFRRADELNEDPLHGFLVGLKLFAEMLAEPARHASRLPCGVVRLSGPAVRPTKSASSTPTACWPGAADSASGFDLIAERYPPRHAVDLDALADMAARWSRAG